MVYFPDKRDGNSHGPNTAGSDNQSLAELDWDKRNSAERSLDIRCVVRVPDSRSPDVAVHCLAASRDVA